MRKGHSTGWRWGRWSEVLLCGFWNREQIPSASAGSPVYGAAVRGGTRGTGWPLQGLSTCVVLLCFLVLTLRCLPEAPIQEREMELVCGLGRPEAGPRQAEP